MHRTIWRKADPTSIVAGLLFLGIGVIYLGIGFAGPVIPYPVALAGVLVCLGVIGLVRIIFRSRRSTL